MWWLKFVAIPWSISFVVGYVGALLPHAEAHRLLDDREAALLLGGQCPDMDCNALDCVPEGCEGLTTTCQFIPFTPYCKKILQVGTIVRCQEERIGFECKDGSGPTLCFRVYVGEAIGGSCGVSDCTEPEEMCGSQTFWCTASPCPIDP